MFSILSIFLIRIFIVSLALFNLVSTRAPTYQPKLLRLNSTQQLFSINQDPVSKNLFIGGRNSLYKLLPNLKLVEEDHRGPWSEWGEKEHLVDQDNLVVLLERKNEDLMHVITCGTGKNGTCLMYGWANVSNFSGFVGEHKYENFVSSLKNTLAFNLDNSSFIVVSEPDGRTNLLPPVISHRKIFDENTEVCFWKPKSPGDLGNWTLNLLPGVRSRYRYEPVTAFRHANFGYVVSNQPEESIDDRLTGRIGRFCLDDSSFHSYTEIHLICSVDDAGDHLSTATSAFFLPTANNLSNLSTGSDSQIGPVLLVAFSSLLGGGSALCAQSLEAIDSAMDRAIEDCNGPGQSSQRNPAFSDNTRCTGTSLTFGQCDVNHENSFVVGRDKLRMEPLFLHEKSITATSAVNVNGKTVAILGDTDGKVIKVLLGAESIVLLEVTVNLATEPLPAEEKMIKRNLLVGSTEDSSVYLLQSNSVIQFPPKSCAIYSTCGQCLKSRDPLDCGWCGTYCDLVDACNSNSSQSVCPPAIYSVSPVSSLFNYQTFFTIEGDNFGNWQRDLGSVSVNFRAKNETFVCTINNMTSEQINCTLEKLDQPVQGYLLVQTNSSLDDDEYQLSGSMSSETISLKNTTIDSIEPLSSFVSQCCNITIYGNDLDVQVVRSVTLEGPINVICEEKELNDTTLKCQIDPVDDLKLLEQSNLTFTVKYGGHEIEIPEEFKSHTLLPTPNFEQIEPRCIVVNTTDVTFSVIGSNFNARDNVTFLLNDSPGGNCKFDSSTKLTCYLHASQSVTGTVGELKMYFELFHVTSNSSLTPQANLTMSVVKMPLFLQSQNAVVQSKASQIELHGQDLPNSENCLPLKISVSNKMCAIDFKNDSWLICNLDSTGLDSTLVYDINYQLGNRIEIIATAQFFSEKMASKLPILVIGSISFIILIVVIIIACLIAGSTRKKKQAPPLPVKTDDQKGEFDHMELSIPDEWKEAFRDRIIDRDSLTLSDKIGDGNFGVVRKGILKDIYGDQKEVAVKLMSESVDFTSNSKRDFMKEATAMIMLDHPKVMSLIGVVFFNSNTPSLVMPFMENGDLHKFLQNKENELTIRQLVSFTLQIAIGMKYIASRGLVHRDLAARNCLVDKDLNVRVADFGLTREIIYSRKNGGQDIPFLWMPPEVLQGGFASKESDVWSYGVTCWEIFTRGVKPWSHRKDLVPSPHSLLALYEVGERLPKPGVETVSDEDDGEIFCPEEMYNLWLLCWNMDPNERPNFKEILQHIYEYIRAKDPSTRRIHSVIIRSYGADNVASFKPKLQLRTSNTSDELRTN